MNYEDREDLLSPEIVVEPAVLAQLRSPDGDPVALLLSVREPEVDHLVAREVIAHFIASEADLGAPDAALPIEEDAAACGYWFGRLLLGPFVDDPVSSARTAAVVDGMYVYELVSIIAEGTPAFATSLTTFLDERASQFGSHSSLTGAIEEAGYLAWCTGLGTAVVLADRS